MPIAPDFTSIYSHDWDINFTMCAPNGHLRYVDLCNLLQLTAAEHSIKGGLSFADMQQHDQAWVLSRIIVEIDALPKWQDKITIVTWIESLLDNFSVRNMEVFLDGKRIAGAATLWAVFNTKLRRSEPLALPHDHFGKFPERHATSARPARINIIREAEMVAGRRVALSDLDIVNHVNNVKYLEWCLDAMDAEDLLDQSISSIAMNFLRELNLDDAVEINTDRSGYYCVTRNSKVCFALIVT